MIRELRYLEGWRKQKGLSQEEMARKLMVSRVTYSNWINGYTSPSPSSQGRIKQLWGQIKGGRSRRGR